jgi:hypothetical protein
MIKCWGTFILLYFYPWNDYFIQNFLSEGQVHRSIDTFFREPIKYSVWIKNDQTETEQFGGKSGGRSGNYGIIRVFRIFLRNLKISNQLTGNVSWRRGVEWSGVPWSRVVEHGVKQAKLRAARCHHWTFNVYSYSFSLITSIIPSTILSHLNEVRLHELTWTHCAKACSQRRRWDGAASGQLPTSASMCKRSEHLPESRLVRRRKPSSRVDALTW